jgi:hypothetical protein
MLIRQQATVLIDSLHLFIVCFLVVIVLFVLVRNTFRCGSSIRCHDSYACEMLWVRSVLHDIGVDVPYPMRMKCDN